MAKKNSQEALDETVADLNERFGAFTVMNMDEKNAQKMEIKTIDTGCAPLNEVFGNGGLPRGRITDVYGEPSSGKSTLALYLAGQVQKQGGRVAWLDLELCYDPAYSASLGIDNKTILVSQPESSEDAFEIANALAKTGIDLIVIDSSAAMVPKAELEGEIGDQQVALQARIMSKGLRILNSICGKSGTAVIFISQQRQKIGVMWGSKVDSSGGRALKFYSSVRLSVTKLKTLKKGVNTTGSRVGIQAVKNKTSVPYKKCEFDLLFGKGIDLETAKLTEGSVKVEKEEGEE